MTFPFLAQEARGIRVLEVPLAEIAEHVDGSVGLVALAAVQSSDGAVAPLDEVEAAAARHGVDVLVDVTQAVGWLPVAAGRFAYTVCAAYKWLLSPRGTAFLTVRRDRWDALVPSSAGWYAGDEPWSSIYGTPLRLAPDARRFDVSPGWHSWVGTASSLALLERVGMGDLHAHALAVEAAFAAGGGAGARGPGHPCAGRRRRGARPAGPARHRRGGARRPAAGVLPRQQHDRGGRAGREGAARARRRLIGAPAQKSRRPVSAVTPRVASMSEDTAPQTRLTLDVVAFDCPDARALAGFYAGILGWEVKSEDDDWVTIVPPEGVAGHALAFQQIDDYVAPTWPGGAHPQQAHIDIEADDLEAGERVVLAAGATRHEHQPSDRAEASSSTSTRPGTRSAWCHERPGDRGGRPRQEVRRLHGRRRRQLLGAVGDGVLDARAQRRGQDDDRADDDDAEHPDQRLGAGGGLRRRRRAGCRAPPDGPHRPVRDRRRAADRPREPAVDR